MVSIEGDGVIHPGTIEGEVHLPEQYELKQGMSMADLLAQAGGTTMVGGYLQNADVSNSHIIRANGIILKATRRFWFDPGVPPGSTLVVPEKAPGGPLRRNPRFQGFVVGLVASGLVWYGTN